ncbi:molybdopterin-dependent oxidoreductase [Crenobacter cavernae]|uniref:Sulfite oxidase-like oxidoreductase n=1 Tax=Crenobacter cavernae TaxID=2290923 RepID=A0ABY0FHC0_9NEIS|nr:molybdopterin-dependent oxidoreductase [Crenobacter cavernae]RXZ44878.1 sulfite oxidase-like oxidoreductase [Crenobacter cavernae]
MRSVFLPIALALSMLVADPAHAMPDPADGERFATERVEVAGLVKHPQSFDVAALEKLPAVTLENVTITGHNGHVMRRIGTLTGVKLSTLLDAAYIKVREPEDVKKMAIVVSASDGYKAVFSWNELFNSPAGDAVVLGYAVDGKAIGKEEGRLMLISAHDKRTGPRHVRWVKRVEVLKITD